MFSGFYDIHCHILPGVDDGAPNFFDAMDMIKMAREDGTRHIVLTPHYHAGHFECQAENLRTRFEIIRRETAQQYPDMELFLGAEICYHLEAAERLARGELLSMTDTDYVLIEFFPQSDKKTIIEGLQEVQMIGKQPVLAHVERYNRLVGDYETIETLMRMGVYIQVNASSILGKNGHKVKKFTKILLDNEQIDFVASDAHGLKHRRPMLGECAAYVSKKWGAEYAEDLFINNPRKMLSGKYL